jgi:hypothetical protein
VNWKANLFTVSSSDEVTAVAYIQPYQDVEPEVPTEAKR